MDHLVQFQNYFYYNKRCGAAQYPLQTGGAALRPGPEHGLQIYLAVGQERNALSF